MKNIKNFDSPTKILGAVILLVEGILTLVLTIGKLTESQKTWLIIGMLSLLALTIIGAIIIHWINCNTKLRNIQQEKKMEEFEYDIFISFPIEGINEKSDREMVNKFAVKLVEELKKIGYKRIFNASAYFSHSHDHQPPKVACEIDFNAIDKCKNFLLLYPNRLPTSSLIELGYALAMQKKIIMCSTSVNILPFLARGFTELFENVNYIEYSNNEHLINILTENHAKYFNG